MKKTSVLFVCMIALVALVAWAPNASAMSNFNDPGAEGLSCATCHPSLANSGPGNANHDAHAAPAGAGNCNLCHAGGFDNPNLDDCVQCHGRQQDAGGDVLSNGVARGLRQHHQNRVDAQGDPNPASNCGQCHSDANGPKGVDEDVQPAFYPGAGAEQLDPCNGSEENFDSATVSLDNDGNGATDFADFACGGSETSCVDNIDNDGDGLTDCDDTVDCSGDPACQAGVCGDGVVDPGEDCDGTECCEANCTFSLVDTPCDNGEFCTVNDTCDGAGTCDAGLPNSCSDGVGCTDDSCDEAANQCVNTPNDANCPDDGLFCNGDEFCDPTNDCSSTGDPCLIGTVCNEDTDTCDTAPACGDGVVDPGEDCDPAAPDTVCCEADCTFSLVDTPCDNGEFCTVNDTCDGAGACLGGDPRNCSDGVFCTDDSCDEAYNQCVSTPNDANCPDDGLFCNGDEFCDPVNDCVSTGDPCSAGTVCNEETDTCDTAPGGCGDGILDPGEECDDGNTMDGDCCSANCTFEPEGSACDDGEYCTVDDTCDGAGTCVGGDPRDCSDGVGCTDDSCDEANDACVNAPNDANCPDDGLFCNGAEFCDPVNDCVSTGDPCPAGSVCNEDTDTCDVVDDKVTICHIPPGRPDKAKTKSISAMSVDDHLRHGDTLGPCP